MANFTPRQHINPVKLFVGFWILVIFIALVVWICSIIFHKNVDLLVSPTVAHVEINGEEYTNGEYRFSNGTYFIRATMDGFETYENEFKVDGETKVYIALTPLDGNLDWYSKHPEEQMILNTIGDYEATERSRTYAEKDTIFNYTPYYDPKTRFQVFAEGPSDDIVITVKLNTCADDAVTYYKQIFSNWLKDEVKVKAGDYSIKYTTLCE